MAVAQIGSALTESPTNDEPVHLVAGYAYLTTGEYSVDLTHPPLGRVLVALPLLPLRLNHLPADKKWPHLLEVFWENRVPPDTMLLRARLVVIALTVLFGAWLAYWTRRRFGSLTALVALTFFAFDPNLIAHGHYVTTDLIVSFTIFLACSLWADFLDAPSWKALAAAALGLGTALASKYSSLFLLLVLPVLYVAAWYRNRPARPFFTRRGAMQTLAVMVTGAGLVIALTYIPELVARPDWRSFGYFRGLRQLARFNTDGQWSYLLGRFAQHGSWQYFPVAFLVKTPTGILMACFIAVLSILRKRPPLTVPLLCLTLPPLAFFALAMCSSINLGVRHILPVYPFLYVLLAFVLVDYSPLLLRRAWPWTIALLLLLVAVESVANYPRYLSFFNWVSGGPANGSHYLLDSNIDWGQDTENLASFVEQHRLTPLCTMLFGYTPPHEFGPDTRNLHEMSVPGGFSKLGCVVAVSANFVPLIPALRQRQPVGRIGYSIYLYDFRR